MKFADFSTVTTDAKGTIYLEPKTKPDGFLTDYFNAIRTTLDFDEEKQAYQQVEKIRSISEPDDQWNYCEHECSGNEDDTYCWINTKQYTPSLLLNKRTGKLYLHYILDSFNPHFEVQLDELEQLLHVWKTEFLEI